MRTHSMRAELAFLVALPQVVALDNGLGLTPQMGYSSWNDCGSVVTEEHVKATANYMISSGLAAKGFTYVNVDEGWFIGRDPKTKAMVEDKKFFPSGMKGLGEFIHDLEVPGKGKAMKYGLYTCRGVQQCDTPEYIKRCEAAVKSGLMPTQEPHRCEGTHGFEKEDAEWLVAAGADYLKEDSCGGNQTHSVAFSDYAKMRDALNASAAAAGRGPVFFSLCGWEDWYAPPDTSINFPGGPSLGNSYRIHGDGSSWDHLSGCTNTIAEIGKWSKPGGATAFLSLAPLAPCFPQLSYKVSMPNVGFSPGWADPDLLIGPETKKPMHIGGQTDEQARTQLNLWSVFPAPLLISQNMLTWSKYALETYSNVEVLAINQDPVLPGAAPPGSGYKVGKRLVGGDLALPCNGASANCSNVWGRPLSDGKSYVLAFVNNMASEDNVRCCGDCFSNLFYGATPAASYTVRDLWAHADVGHLSRDAMTTDTNAPSCYNATVPPNGGSRIFKLTPA